MAALDVGATIDSPDTAPAAAAVAASTPAVVSSIDTAAAEVAKKVRNLQKKLRQVCLRNQCLGLETARSSGVAAWCLEILL